MDFDTLKRFLFNLPGARLEFPFGTEVMVYKILGKMFILINWEENPISINLKCDPVYAVELRRENFAITPGYHMNKTHWNTILLDGSLEDNFVFELIQQSYDLVVSELPKRLQREVEKLKESEAIRKKLLDEGS